MFQVVSKDLGDTCDEQKIAKSRKTVVGMKKIKKIIIITKKSRTYLNPKEPKPFAITRPYPDRFRV